MEETKKENKVLEWETATEAEEATAKKAEEVVGNAFFAFNLPLQVWISNDDESGQLKGHILNYMPRKERCDELSFVDLFGKEMPTKEEWEAFCNTNIAILKNLARQWEAVRDGKIDYVYYPNTNLEEHIRTGVNPKDEWDKLVNPFK